MASFTQKLLTVNLTLVSGTFDGVSNTKAISGLRVHANIRKMGAPCKNECRVRIFGMRAGDMNRLSTEGLNPLAIHKNLIQVQAGDSDGLTTLYQGEISGAWVSYTTPPNLNFEIHSVSGVYPAMLSATPSSTKGGASIAGLFAALADKMGYSFQNNGVVGSIQNPYLTGSPMSQAQQLADAVSVEWGVDDGQLFIAPRGGIRTAGNTPVVSPSTGMIGYPVWDKQGLVVRALPDPLFKLGGAVEVAGSSVTRANGVWRIHGMEHNLASMDPGDSAWATKLHLAKVGV